MEEPEEATPQRTAAMIEAAATSRVYLDNVWKNFERWYTLRGMNMGEALKQVADISGKEVKKKLVREYDSRLPQQRESDQLVSIVMIAKIMRVNPLELMGGEIDFRKL